MLRLHCAVIAFAVASLAAVPSRAQAPALTLGVPRVSFPEEFSTIGWIRELKDGRVLAIDSKEYILKVLDPKSPQVQTIGRQGQGPGEYTSLLGMWPLRGDSTLVYDGRGFLLFLDGTRYLRTIPSQISGRIAGPYGADTLGHLLLKPAVFPNPPIPAGTMGTFPDTQAIVLGSPDLTRVDTLARVRVGWTIRGVNATGMNTLSRPPMSVGAQVAITPDGWVAVVYPEPYHVEWRSPAGVMTKGAPLPVARVPVDGRQRRAYAEWNAAQAGVTRVDTASLTAPGWPETLPAFVNMPAARSSAAQPLSDGRVLVLRSPNALSPGARYDIVDRAGSLAGTLALPTNERVVGLGRGSIYTATVDNDGIQHLRSYAWPPAR